MIKPPVILLAFANDYSQGGYLNRLGEERNKIKEILAKSRDRDLCEFEILSDATLGDITAVFQNWKYRGRIAIFHFAGHASEYSLFLESPSQKSEYIYASGFASFLGQQEGLKLVFLNGCATEQQADFLHQSGVPAVIATDRKVCDDTAAQMGIDFYRALGGDRTLWQAYEEAVSLCKSRKQEWFPYQRGLGRNSVDLQKGIAWKISHDPKSEETNNWSLSKGKNDPLYSLPKPKGTSKPLCPFPELKEYSKEDAYVFWGRDHKIREVYDLLEDAVTPSVVFCYGVAGVGKSSLMKAGVLPRLSVEYPVTCLNWIDLNSRKELKKLHAKFERSSDSRKHFLFIDDLKEPTELFITQIKSLYKIKPNTCLVLIIRTSMYNKWSTVFSINHYHYNLAPPDKKDIKEIFYNLRSKYQVSIEKELPDRIAGLLLNDTRAPVTPLLQVLLFQLLEMARSKNRDKPHLNWKLYEEWRKKGGWKRFIKNQMQEVDEVAMQSGLLYNILHYFLPKDNWTPTFSTKNLEDAFDNSSHDISHLIQRLKRYFLLCEPVDESQTASEQIRLSHSILTHPLRDLVENSICPGQEAKRMLHYHMTSGKDLDKRKGLFIENSRSAMGGWSTKEKRFLEKCKERNALKLSRKRWLSGLQIGLVTIILSGGMYFNSPYLLLFLILLLVLYER